MYTKNIPIILRTKKNGRNDKFSTSSTIQTFIAFNAKNINFSSALNTLPNTNFEKETNKILHHQRKQLHNPLDKQCDTYDSNNNRNKKARFDRTNDSANYEVNTSRKKSKSNKSKKHSPKKSRKATTYKTSGRKTASSNSNTKSSSFDTAINISPNVVANNVFNTDVPVQSSHESYNSSFENDFSKIGTTFNEYNNFCINNETTNSSQKCHDVNSNPVISEKSMESDEMKQMFEKDFINCTLIESMNNNNGVNILFDPELLHPCAYANCTSCNEDNIIFDDSFSTINDMEMEYLTPYICSDFIIDDYDYILGETWLQESFKKNLCCENIEEINSAKENDGNDLTNTVENNANVLVIEQSNLQPYSTVVSYDNDLTNCLKFTEDMDIFNEEKSISQDETLTQTNVLIDTSVSNDTCEPQENKEGKWKKSRNSS